MKRKLISDCFWLTLNQLSSISPALVIRGQNHRWECRVDFDPLGLSA